MQPDLPQEVLHARPGSLSAADWARRVATRGDEVDDIGALLLAHVAVGTPECEARAVARRIALATLGDRHLWEDLGLPSRAALSLLMQRHFPDLVAKNAAGMRWKKFIHRQLCEQAEVLICRSPSCTVCDEQAVCFAPE